MWGGMKVVPPLFFSESMITIVVKFTYIMGTSFTKFRLFVHKVSIISTLYPRLHETLYAGHVELTAEVPEPFTHAVFQLVIVQKMAFLGRIL
jgi:hypothetical protein